MGFVRRLNSKELVGDPCAGAEVYPITATNAVYREGGENLEDILIRLGNKSDRKVVQDISYVSNTNKLHKEFTDDTTEDITLPNWIKTIQCESGSDIDTVGTPSVTASTNNSNTILTFHQLKGASGSSATITEASASISEDGGSPSCEVTLGGTSSARTFNFAFKNINGKDGQDSTFNAADITVSTEAQLLDAIAYSHGWFFTKYNNTATHLIDDTATDTSGGETKTTGACITRIHLANNIQLTNSYTVDLSHCEINGYSFDINFKGITLNIQGRSAKFNEIRFGLLTSGGSTRQSSDSDVIKMFSIKGVQATHSKFRFINCQFNKIFPRDTFIEYVRNGSSSATYSTYVDGFETNGDDQDVLNVTESTGGHATKDGNHNLIITRRYSTFAITVNITADTSQESRILYDSSVTLGTHSGVTAKNIYS